MTITSSSRRLVLVSAAILIDGDHRVLLAQRPSGKPLSGLWEFPGGKIESGETPEYALCRELFEELAIEVEERDLKPFTFISENCNKFHLLMILYTVTKWKGTPKGQEGQAIKWLSASELGNDPMPRPDLPLIPKLQEFLRTTSKHRSLN